MKTRVKDKQLDMCVIDKKFKSTSTSIITAQKTDKQSNIFCRDSKSGERGEHARAIFFPLLC